MADTCQLAGWLKKLQARVDRRAANPRTAHTAIDSSDDPNELTEFIDHYFGVIKAIFQQAVECAYFVRDYANNKSFGESFSSDFAFDVANVSRGVARAVKSSVSTVDSKIDDYVTKLKELREKLRDNNVAQCNIQVNRVLEATEALQKTTTELCKTISPSRVWCGD